MKTAPEPPKRKRAVVTAGDRIAAVRRVLAGEKRSDVARDMGVSYGSVAKWCQAQGVPRTAHTAPKHTPDQIKRGIALCAGGETLPDAARIVGMKPQSLSFHCRKAGVKPPAAPRRGKPPHPRKAEIVEALAAGDSTRTVAMQFDAGLTTVHSYAREAGIKVRRGIDPDDAAAAVELVKQGWSARAAARKIDVAVGSVRRACAKAGVVPEAPPPVAGLPGETDRQTNERLAEVERLLVRGVSSTKISEDTGTPRASVYAMKARVKKEIDMLDSVRSQGVSANGWEAICAAARKHGVKPERVLAVAIKYRVKPDGYDDRMSRLTDRLARYEATVRSQIDEIERLQVELAEAKAANAVELERRSLAAAERSNAELRRKVATLEKLLAKSGAKTVEQVLNDRVRYDFATGKKIEADADEPEDALDHADSMETITGADLRVSLSDDLDQQFDDGYAMVAEDVLEDMLEEVVEA